ncbi:hypothetical protein [Caulobacter sp. 17J65-9]|uniref:hypothetical protein n=1 Tax=Caulobacter sp. 17J65-9 TaxID=2709382 RepID=UPI0013C566B0|nr:hypothetical protein [Caulobacter sp. 17J65-9]NEX91660.1 hypothetical protein [Caulobacter sp. 17J65-9]
MKKSIVAGLIAASALFAGSSVNAANFQEQMDRCLSRFANTKDAASVMLECTADAGKLSGCKVVEDSAAGKGFDKAALCIADALPMGSKSGVVKVPLKFPGGN